MIKEYKCVGGPLDGQTMSVDRDNAPIYSPPLELKGTEVVYTMCKSDEDGEWYLVWDEDADDPHLVVEFTPEEAAALREQTALLDIIRTVDPSSEEYAVAYEKLYRVRPA